MSMVIIIIIIIIIIILFLWYSVSKHADIRVATLALLLSEQLNSNLVRSANKSTEQVVDSTLCLFHAY
jgi:hypothetical protein